MALGATEPLDGPVREHQVDLARGSAQLLGCEAEAREHPFGNPVMSLVLDDALPAPDGEATLPSVPVDEPELLEGRHVRKGGGSADPKVRGDSVQGGSAVGGLAGRDRLQGIDLASSQAFEKLHGRCESSILFMGYPNF